MCLAVIAVDFLQDWPLIIVANRDEYHERPTAALGPWQDKNDKVFAGRDLKAGGTWLGANTLGRIALLTNYREPGRHNTDAASRGQLVEKFLDGVEETPSYLNSVLDGMQAYNGFNLLLSDHDRVWFLSNRMTDINTNTPLSSGVYGLSNATLDTPWPKLTRTRDAVRLYLQTTTEPTPAVLFDIFADWTKSPDDQLPMTGLPLERERQLSSPFIVDPVYGTRSTSIIFKHRSGLLRMMERSFDSQGHMVDQQDWAVEQQACPIAD